MKKKFAGIGVALVLALGLTGCGQAPWEDSLRDLEGVQVRDPAETILYNNVDKHPNVVLLCLDGLGFATTTRPDMGSVMRTPERDAHCATLGRGKEMR